MNGRQLQLRSLARAAWLAFAFAVTFAARADAQATYTVRRESAGDPLGTYLGMLVDDEGSLRIDDVQKKEFHPVDAAAPSFGFIRKPAWFRFTVDNPASHEQPWVLELAYPHLDHIQLYVPKADGGWDVREAGDQFPFAQRELNHRNFMFRLKEPAQGRRTYYLRVKTTGSLSLPILAWTFDTMLGHEEHELPVIWLLYGVIVVMALYNGFLFVAIRRVEYLYYVAYNLSLLGLELALTGQGFQFVYPSSPWLANLMIPLVASGVFWSSSMFMRAFLSLSESLPWASRFFLVCASLAVGVMLLSLLGPPGTALRAAMALALVITVVAMLVTTVLLARGLRAAYFFALAWGALFVGVLAYIGKSYGVLPNTLLSEWGIQVGAAAEVVLLSLALADRINLMRKSMGELNAQLSLTVVDLQSALNTAEEATRAKSDFLATMSHELRTPLNAIINIPQGLLQDFTRAEGALCSSCSSVFELDAQDTIDGATPCPHCEAVGTLQRQRITRYVGRPEHTVHHLSMIERSGKHLLQMVNGVLDFSKLEARALRLKLDTVEVGVIVSEAIDTVSELAQSAGIALELELTPELRVHTLFADTLRIKQVLINLIGNAIKFSNGRGAVTVSVRSEPRHVVFSVRDSGIGIAPENLQKVFERFEQVDQGDTRRYGGSGLGLSISRSLVEMHGGTIWVESTLGVGSTFSFRLPEDGPQLSHESKQPEEPISMVLNRVPRISNDSRSVPNKELGS